MRHQNDNANATTIFVGVDAGSLNLVGSLVGFENDGTPTVANNRTLAKVGTGTLRTSGVANTITGYSVLEGILELNKTTGPAIAGTLNIGDNVGGDNSAQVRYVSGAGADQIGAVTVSIATDGLLNLNNYGATDTVGAVTMIAGDTSIARIATGSATTNLDFTGLTVTGRPGITTAVAATVTGGLSFAATRTLTVNDSPGDVELSVSAVIGQSATSGLTKAGAGRLVLSGNNTYDGVTTVSAGALRVQNVGALGVVAGGTTVSSGAALETDLAGTNTITNEALTLNGSGIINGDTTAVGTTVLGTGALRSRQGTTTWSGTVTIAAGNTALDVTGGSTLILNNVLALGANATQKLGDGTLELSGTVANTGTGTFSVNQGTLRLNKTDPAAIAIPAALIIGDNIGVDNADQVVYAATGSTDQIANAANVTVLSTGLLNLAGQSDTIKADPRRRSHRRRRRHGSRHAHAGR